MHPFIHPLSAAVDPAYESKSDWEIFKAIARKFSEVAPEVLGVETDVVAVPILHDTAAEIAQDNVRDWKKGECDLIPGKTAPAFIAVERDYPNLYKRFTALGPLMEKLGNGGKGISWDTKDEVHHLRDLNDPVTDEGVTKGMPKIETAIDAAEVILMLAPETNGAGRGQGVAGARQGHGPRPHPSRRGQGGREDPLPRHAGPAAQDHLLADLVGHRERGGLLQRRLDQRARADPLAHALRPPAALPGPSLDARLRRGALRLPPAGGPQDHHQGDQQGRRRGHAARGAELHHAAPEVGHPFDLHRQPADADAQSRRARACGSPRRTRRTAGIVDNDWIELYNANGALTARAVVSQRIKEGTTFMYHAQEKIVNTPGSEITGNRGGIHNSVTRTILKPTHMIGGYAQLSYGFNYYGTVGSNRDEFVIVRKMRKVDWLDQPRAAPATPSLEAAE